MEDLDNHIERALRKDVSFKLPENFSDRIVNLIMARSKRERSWELFGIITAAILFIAALGVTLYFTDVRFSLGALTFLSEHLGLITFGVLFIVFLHMIDKKLIRKHQVS